LFVLIELSSCYRGAVIIKILVFFEIFVK